MAERGINKEQDKRWEAIGMIVKPFVVYYVIDFITALLLTSLVSAFVRAVGGEWEKGFTEQKATVSAVIGGLAMASGILPLFSTFRYEIQKENNRCNEKEIVRKEQNDCYETIVILKKFLLTILLAFTCSIAVNILFLMFHLTESSETYVRVAEHQYGVMFPAGLFLYGIVSPFAEEVVFRGIIYNRMKRLCGTFSDENHSSYIAPLILSSLLFGVYHGNIVQMLYGFLMGMLIAYVYEACGRFGYAFLFHAAANVVIYVITGNPSLYERFMTPRTGLVFAVIAAMLLSLLSRSWPFRSSR